MINRQEIDMKATKTMLISAALLAAPLSTYATEQRTDNIYRFNTDINSAKQMSTHNHRVDVSISDMYGYGMDGAYTMVQEGYYGEVAEFAVIRQSDKSGTDTDVTLSDTYNYDDTYWYGHSRSY